MTKATLILLIPLILLLLLSPSIPLSVSAAETQVSASIGEYRFTLYGLTSPDAEVTIQGMGIYDQTVADEEGNFSFQNRFSPFSPREACITAQDQFGRLSSPTCLPPFPTRYNVNIGPVLLPATLSLDKNDYYIGDSVVLSGQTIPNSQVNLSMFTKSNSLFDNLAANVEIVKSVYAVNLPEYTAKADKDGNFSISLPSSKAASYRLFTRTQVGEDMSPKSGILNLTILPIWMIVIKYLFFIWQILRTRLIEIIIIGEIIAASYYIYSHYLRPHKIKALMIREKHEIEKIEA